jgi:LPXTG-motif cell wall-anchored protein
VKYITNLFWAIAAVLVTLWLGGGSVSAQEVSPDTVETTVVETAPPPLPEVCVPQGNVVTDIYTGESYTYGVPTQIGFDTCGTTPIPDACIKWSDEFYGGVADISTIWSVQHCGPVTEVVETTVTEVVETTVTEVQGIQQLPSTGANSSTPYIAAIGGIMFLSGGALRFASRRNRNF